MGETASSPEHPDWCKCQDCQDYGYIYFIAGGDLVKIGFSRSVEDRLKRLSSQAPIPLELLHCELGTYRTEKIFHRHFADLRAHGEWFRRTEAMDAFLENRKYVREITGGGYG